MAKDISDEIIRIIREAADTATDRGFFLNSLQSRIEQIPGAYVSFVTRDADYVRENLRDGEAIPDEDLQAVLNRAAMSDIEGYAVQDAVSEAVFAAIDEFSGDDSALDANIG